LFIGVFINAESLHSGVPCGRFFHSAKAPFHQPPQHHKQECSFIPFHKSYAIALRVLADAYPRLFFVLKKFTKNSQRFNASAQSTPSTKVILFIPFSHTLAPYYITQSFCKRKPNMLAVASSISMHSVPGGRYFHPLPIPTLHCIFIPSATSARKARVLRTLAPLVHIPIILQNQPSIFLLNKD
jgi:hypothetical protein